MVAYTGTYARDETWVVRAWIFISMASGILFLKEFLAFIIPDEPHEVLIQIQRQEYIVGKVLDDIRDEDDDELIKGIDVKLDYTIRITDDDPL